MSTTKRQHFVPRVYLKSWGTPSASLGVAEKASSVYVYYNYRQPGEQSNIDSVLWMPRLYTVCFSDRGFYSNCPKIMGDFVNQIYDMLRINRNEPVYGKIGYSIIKTKQSIRKHMDCIDDWEFFYDDGNPARKIAIRNGLSSMTSYIIEDGLSSHFEAKWSRVLQQFISEIKNSNSKKLGSNKQVINNNTAEEMLEFFFMMFCRNPEFDGLGTYTWAKETLLEPIIGANANEFINGIWHSELYKMLYKTSKGHYHSLIKAAIGMLQMVLYEATAEAGTFITSDRPAFLYNCIPEKTNMNGFVFPLSPSYLLFICKGEGPINIVDYRPVDQDVVQYFNRTIYQNRSEIVISSYDTLYL